MCGTSTCIWKKIPISLCITLRYIGYCFQRQLPVVCVWEDWKKTKVAFVNMNIFLFFIFAPVFYLSRSSWLNTFHSNDFDIHVYDLKNCCIVSNILYLHMFFFTHFVSIVMHIFLFRRQNKLYFYKSSKFTNLWFKFLKILLTYTFVHAKRQIKFRILGCFWELRWMLMWILRYEYRKERAI